MEITGAELEATRKLVQDAMKNRPRSASTQLKIAQPQSA
jgi:hypothetical protein